METAAAIISALVLLVGAVKLVFWAAERFSERVKNYDASRAAAASVPQVRGQTWDDSFEPSTPLDLF